MRLVSSAAALFVFLACASVFAESLTFTKSFPGSQPPFTYVSVTRQGAIEYKEAPAEENPLKAQMSDASAAELFEMAEKLEYFSTPLESGLKVANTGKKTFRYADPSGKVSEAVFNYSTSPVAQHLLDRFEQIAASERAYIQLERAVRFDKLGVNDALAGIETLWLHKQLAAPSQFVPLLNRVATHESFMHLARERAARLRDQFQGPGAAPTPVVGVAK